MQFTLSYIANICNKDVIEWMICNNKFLENIKLVMIFKEEVIVFIWKLAILSGNYEYQVENINLSYWEKKQLKIWIWEILCKLSIKF